MADDAMMLDQASDPTSSKILKSDQYQALSEARNALDDSRREAEQLVAQAHAQAEEIREQARIEGRAEAAALVAEYKRRMQQELAALEARMGEVVLASLKRLLKPHPPTKVIAAAVNRTIEEIDAGQGAVLIVAPNFVRPLREQLSQIGISETLIEVRGDPDCPEQSSILRSDFGDIELGIDLQLRALERGFHGAESDGA